MLFAVEQMKSKILQRVESVTSDTGATSGEEGKVKKRFKTVKRNENFYLIINQFKRNSLVSRKFCNL